MPTATSTLVPLSAQARAFAEPILKAIANRPPDFADDFSTADRGWQWDRRMAGQIQIANGVMRVSGPGSHGIFPPHNLLRSKNFIFEFQVRLISAGNMGVFFRQQNAENWYMLELSSSLYPPLWRVIKAIEGSQSEISMGRSNVLPLGDANQVTVIARENQFAVYVNESPTVYFKDTSILQDGNLMQTFSGRSDKSSVEGEFDQVKFWNLDNVQGLP